jgi:hypothetical protein
MTYKLLKAILEENKIPNNVRIMSDSGWECCETDTDGIWFCKEKNLIVLTQGFEKSYQAGEEIHKGEYICLWNEDYEKEITKELIKDGRITEVDKTCNG